MHYVFMHFVRNHEYKMYNNRYCQISNISHIKSQKLNVSHLVLQLTLCNILKLGAESRMNMWLEQRRKAMLQLHLSDQQILMPTKVRLILEVW